MPSLIIIVTVWAVLFIRLIWIVLVFKLKATGILIYHWRSFACHPSGFFSYKCLVGKPQCLKRAAFSSLASIFFHRLILHICLLLNPPCCFSAPPSRLNCDCHASCSLLSMQAIISLALMLACSTASAPLVNVMNYCTCNSCTVSCLVHWWAKVSSCRPV